MKILSFDGNVHVGKTTLIEQLEAEHPTWCFIPEHSSVVQEHNLVTSDMTHQEVQVAYIEAEKIRTRYANRSLPKDTIVLDRSIVSMIAHAVYLFRKHSINQDFLFDELLRLIVRKEILIPNAFFLVFLSKEEIRKRHEQNTKNTPDYMVSDLYIETVDDIMTQWFGDVSSLQENANGYRVCVKEMTIREVTESVKNIHKKLNYRK